MAKCYICGKSRPVMKVICPECADKSCAGCKYHIYIERLDLMMCRNVRGMSGALIATDYCSKYKEEE